MAHDLTGLGAGQKCADAREDSRRFAIPTYVSPNAHHPNPIGAPGPLNRPLPAPHERKATRIGTLLG